MLEYKGWIAIEINGTDVIACRSISEGKRFFNDCIADLPIEDFKQIDLNETILVTPINDLETPEDFFRLLSEKDQNSFFRENGEWHVKDTAYEVIKTRIEKGYDSGPFVIAQYDV